MCGSPNVWIARYVVDKHDSGRKDDRGKQWVTGCATDIMTDPQKSWIHHESP